jgi:protein-tyrosine phosphatase
VTEWLERSFVALARRLERPADRLLVRPPLRGWLRSRALRAWRAERAPLILCHGNINRSAFAAELARRRRPAASSGGFSPVENRPSPDATIACAAGYGIDLTAHRSRRVTREELRSAPVIFVFDLENLARLATHCPLALARTHLIGALDTAERVLIADPHGRGERVLADTLAQIARAVDHAERTR